MNKKEMDLKMVDFERFLDKKIAEKQRDLLLIDIADRLYCDEYTRINYPEFYDMAHASDK